ncbi:MAG: hypothetical protein GXP09_00110 [Gammaproteobacteria bacterium]|nr:hypothetical protein [Gammaproteobacteria bacterium]
MATVASYIITEASITCFPHPNSDNETLYAALIGPVMAIWLELNDFNAFHASAICNDQSCYAFAARSGGGKSSLLGSFLHNTQCQLVTDDLLPVFSCGSRYSVHGGHGAIRLHEQQITKLLKIDPSSIPRSSVTEKIMVPIQQLVANRLTGTAPLKRIYLLERSPEPSIPISITRLHGREALIGLLRNQYSINIIEKLGKLPERMKLLARLAKDIPVCRLIYPSGYEHLPNTVSHIMRDFSKSY